jgi:hypothetical protein
MSARESGSETWPRFAAFSGDNLNPGDAPEEDHVDHRAEPPSWLSGTAAVGTGADPPDQETGNGEQHNGAEHSNAEYSNAEYRGGQAYPENGTYPESGNGEAPGFTGSGFSSPSHDGQGYAPGFGDVAADPPDFGGAPGGSQDFGNAPGGVPGFGDGAGTPDFGGAPDSTPDFGSAPAAGSGFGDISTGAQDFSGIHGGSPVFGADRLSDPFDIPAAPFDSSAATGFDKAGGAGFASQAEPAQAFSDDKPRSDYGGDYRAGEYRSGFGASQTGTPLPSGPLPSGPLPSSPQAGSPFGSGGPAVGTMYGGQQAYQPGQENGAGTQTQSAPFTSQYPPVEPPGRSGKMTASLRAVRRPKSAASAKKRAQAGRQAQLTVTRVEPWSVMKFSFVISLVAFIVLFVAVALLYAVLSGLGVFSSLQHTVQNITSSQSASGFNLGSYLSASRVLGYTGLLGALNVVLITALATVGSVLYNITAGLAGGVEITLKESD